MTTPPNLDRAQRRYRALLWVYPPEFRRRHSDDAVELFRDRYRDEYRRRGRWGVVALWSRTLVTMMVHGMSERVSERRRRPAARAWPGVWHDIRYAARSLRRRRAFAATIVGTLALGIGANTALFTVVRGVVWTPLPFSEPERLVHIWSTNEGLGLDREGPSPGDLVDWQAGATTFDGLAGWYLSSGTFRDETRVEEWRVAQVTPDFFRIMRAEPQLGRSFYPEIVAREGRSVILSDRLWRRTFSADPDIIGRRITISGQRSQIVGIMPPDFAFPDPAVEFWSAWDLRLAYDHLPAMPRDWRFLRVVGRLAPTASLESAGAELNALAVSLENVHPVTNEGWRVRVASLHTEIVGPVQSTMFVALSAVGLILLLACANVANLLLADAPTRARELAVRTTLGATRTRVARQLLTENLLLGGAGGIVGWIVGWLVLRTAIAVDAGTIPRLAGVSTDAMTVMFAAALAVGTSVAFGFAPILYAARTSATETLKTATAGRGGGARGTHALRHAFVVAQQALAVMLLLGVGLFGESFRRLVNVEPGFDVRNILTFRVSLDSRPGESGYIAPYYDGLLERIAATPGVERVGAAQTLPLHPIAAGNDFNRPHRLPSSGIPSAESPKIQMRIVTPGYFDAVGMSVLDGTPFDGREGPTDPYVVVLNATAARSLWPDEPAVGQWVEIDFREGWHAYRVVAVVRDTKHYGPRAAAMPEAFLAHRQAPYLAMSVVAKTSVPPEQLIEPMRALVATHTPAQPAHAFYSMEDLLGDAVARERFLLVILAVFGGVAVALAAAGVYGVMSYVVSERRHEIGVRVALGAAGSTVRGMIVGQALALALLGVGIGLAASQAAANVVRSLLFEIQPSNAVVLAAVSGTLLAVALLAAYIPARRASRVEPMAALRQD